MVWHVVCLRTCLRFHQKSPRVRRHITHGHPEPNHKYLVMYVTSFSVSSCVATATPLRDPKMEFLEEETRPRFLFHSRAPSSTQDSSQQPQKLNKRLTFLCTSLSILLSMFSIFFTQSEILKSLLIWFSLSFLLGPFAPLSITAGDINVGQGKLLQPSDPLPTPHLEDPKKRFPGRRQKTRKPDDPQTSTPPPPPQLPSVQPNLKEFEKKSDDLVSDGDESDGFDEKEWTDQDFEVLKKQMLRHPVGETGRWELIAEAFIGRHKIDSVIKMGKSMGERRPGNGGNESFAQFLKQRKPLDKRLLEVSDEVQVGEKQISWSSGEDIALLNALKTFPKEVSMRWEKIAAAVPGRSKAACMKRVAELKRDFRSSKASVDS